jgi:anti-sigma-K factor RskA
VRSPFACPNRSPLTLSRCLSPFLAPSLSSPPAHSGPQATATEGRSGGRSAKWAVAATAAVAAGALGLVASLNQHTRATALVSEVDALQALHSSNALMRNVGRVRVPGAYSQKSSARSLQIDPHILYSTR